MAIDTVFPSSKPPSHRMACVSSLVTIGCPFDLVRMLQPDYFGQRFAVPSAGPRWVNIYDPIDLLGSNFRNDTAREEAAEGVRTINPAAVKLPTVNIPWNPGQELTLVSALMLASLRVHAQYWGSNPHAETALGYVVTQLFNDTLALR